jgi:hypothetical protein
VATYLLAPIPTSTARKVLEDKVKANAQRNRQCGFGRSKLRHGDKIKHGVHWSKAPIAAAVKSRSHVFPGLDPFWQQAMWTSGWSSKIHVCFKPPSSVCLVLINLFLFIHG